MPDDFSDPKEWTIDNSIKLRKLWRVRNHVQDDIRCANFICLHKSSRIAMIDFESVIKVGLE